MTAGSDEHEPGLGVPAHREVLAPALASLRGAGFYAYFTLDQAGRWTVASDTDAGRVDVRVGLDGLELDIWDTSPGLFWDEEDERMRAARERLARVSLPAVARGMAAAGQEIWWDEQDHGVGVRLRSEHPFAAQDQLGEIARVRLAELNQVIELVERRLLD